MADDIEADGTILKDGSFNKLYIKRHEECR